MKKIVFLGMVAMVLLLVPQSFVQAQPKYVGQPCACGCVTTGNCTCKNCNVGCQLKLEVVQVQPIEAVPSTGGWVMQCSATGCGYAWISPSGQAIFDPAGKQIGWINTKGQRFTYDAMAHTFAPSATMPKDSTLFGKPASCATGNCASGS